MESEEASDPLGIQTYVHLLYTSSDPDAVSSVELANTTELKEETLSSEIISSNDYEEVCYKAIKTETAGNVVEMVQDNDESVYYSYTDDAEAEAIPQQLVISASDTDNIKEKLKSKLLANHEKAALIEEDGEPLKQSMYVQPTKATEYVHANVKHKLKAKLLEKHGKDALMEEDHSEITPNFYLQLLEKHTENNYVENDEENITVTGEATVEMESQVKDEMDRMTEKIQTPKILQRDMQQEGNGYLCSAVIPSVTFVENMAVPTETVVSTHCADEDENITDDTNNGSLIEIVNPDTKILSRTIGVDNIIGDIDEDVSKCIDKKDENVGSLSIKGKSRRKRRKAAAAGRWGRRRTKLTTSDTEIDIQSEPSNSAEAIDAKESESNKVVSEIQTETYPVSSSRMNTRVYRKHISNINVNSEDTEDNRNEKHTNNTAGNKECTNGVTAKHSSKKRKSRKSSVQKNVDIEVLNDSGCISKANGQTKKLKHERINVAEFRRKGTRYSSLDSIQGRKCRISRQSKKNRSATKSDKKAYSSLCEKCGLVLNSRISETYHRKRHIKYQDLAFLGVSGMGCVCHLCGNTYKTESGLHYHMQTIHNCETYKCTVPGCEKVFDHYMNRRVHVQRVHLREKKYKCEICGQKFKMNDSLKCHIARTHKWNPDDPANQYRCKLCNKALKSKYLLDNHIKIHKNQKDFSCPYAECGKRFVCKYYAKRHLKLHESDRPYTCDECGEGFSRRTYLENHRWKHTGTKQFQCSECNRGFVQKGNLMVHIRTVHYHERDCERGTCPDCDKTFSNKSNMLAHYKRVHSDQDCKATGHKRAKRETSIEHETDPSDNTEVHYTEIKPESMTEIPTQTEAVTEVLRRDTKSRVAVSVSNKAVQVMLLPP